MWLYSAAAAGAAAVVAAFAAVLRGAPRFFAATVLRARVAPAGAAARRPAAFFAATGFLAAARFAGAFFAAAALLSTAPAIRNFERSFTSRIQAGARPRPVHVAPVFGSAYFGATGALARRVLTTPFAALTPGLRPRLFPTKLSISTRLKPCLCIRSRIFARPTEVCFSAMAVACFWSFAIFELIESSVTILPSLSGMRLPALPEKDFFGISKFGRRHCGDIIAPRRL